ncbi:MAG: Crp/Fnr family transcriptional regulator [Cyanobacteria bacterium J06628_6]
MSTSTLKTSMSPDLLSERFPLFNAASPGTLDRLLAVASELDYPAGRTVLMEDSWGNAVYFITAGWVKVRHEVADDYVTLAVLGKGDFFGEMAILDESPRSTDVVSLSTVKLVSIPAHQFIETLFQDSQLHHRMLQLMVQRLRQTNARFQLRHKPPAVKLAHTLQSLAAAYGTGSSNAPELFSIAPDDLSAIADVAKDDVVKIMEKLTEKGWIQHSETQSTLSLPGLKHLIQLSKKA